MPDNVAVPDKPVDRSNVGIAPVADIQVSGGAGGFRAKGEDLVAMSALTDEVAGDTLKTALAGHKFLAEPDVLASALLNPSGVAKFEAAMAMVDVIRADEMSRFSVCADDSCEALVIDLSRNRSRRYCSTTCGNRNAVAAYRSRQRGDGTASDR